VSMVLFLYTTQGGTSWIILTTMCLAMHVKLWKINVPVILPRLNTGRQRNCANPPADNPAEYDRRSNSLFSTIVDDVVVDSRFIANATL